MGAGLQAPLRVAALAPAARRVRPPVIATAAFTSSTSSRQRRRCRPRSVQAAGSLGPALLEAPQAAHHAVLAWGQLLGAAGAGLQAPLLRSMPLADLAAALSPACFDPSCQAEKDALLVVSLAVPVLALVAGIAYLLRPPPQGSLDDGTVFQDSETGALFEAPEGASPERDRKGQLAFKAVSYTPWPVDEGAEGERIRIDVGPVGARRPRTFVFSKILPQPSQLVAVTLERPLGIEFEEDARRKRAVVAGFTPGGHAEQRMRQAKLNASVAASAALEGDVLRAVTATNIVYGRESLIVSVKPPQRHIVVFGADGQTWPKTVTALKRGLFADGPVTLVLERRVEQPGGGGGSSSGGSSL